MWQGLRGKVQGQVDQWLKTAFSPWKIRRIFTLTFLVPAHSQGVFGALIKALKALSLGRPGAGYGKLEPLGWLCTHPHTACCQPRGDTATPRHGDEPAPSSVGGIVSYCLFSFGKRRRGIVKCSANKLHPLGFSSLTLSIHMRHFFLNKLWRLKKVQK